MADQTYPDSEEIAGHVRSEVETLSGLSFDHGGKHELPIRRDVQHYTLERLFKAGDGLITAGGFNPPAVRLETDGTVRVTFNEEERYVSLWVPCSGVVVLERYTLDADSYFEFVLRSEDEPDDFDDEVEHSFAWLEGGVS